jgi:sigma-B regulation protein RsbU (phosphoserine phosphatase)
VTFYFGIYDDTTGMLTYTNGGHPPPILIRDGTATKLEVTGTVVGAFPASRYEERQIALASGDLLVAYTDGITEPENAYGEMFGEERLIDLLVKYQSAGASEIVSRSLEAALQWTGSPELQDDMTMLIAQRVGA